MVRFFLFTAQFLAKFITVILLVGCVSAHKDSAVMLQSYADEPAPAQPSKDHLPNVGLTPDLLYQTLVAEIASQRGQLDVAANSYLKLARATHDPRLVERATQIALLMHDGRKVLAALKLWVDLEPDNIEAREGLITSLVQNKQPGAALEHMEKLLSSPPAVPKTPVPGIEPDFITEQGPNFMMIAGLLGAQQDKQAALKLMEKFVASHSGNPDALLAYSNLALSLGDLKLARNTVDKALRLEPGWLNAVVLRARILSLQGEASQALAYLKEALEGAPKNLTARVAYARLLVDAKRLEEARAQFEIMAKQVPDNAEILLALGLLSLQINQPDDAERYLTQVYKLQKHVPEASYYLGQIAESKKQYEAAINWYKNVDQGEAYMDAQLRIVGLLARQGNIAGARAYLQTVEVQDPQQQKLLLLAEADLLREEKRYDDAMTLYNNALRQVPDDSDLLYSRAMLAVKMDRLDLLERDLRSILRRDPNNAQALNALGYTLADRTTRYQEALSYIQRALEIAPHDGAILDSMGWIQYRLGNRVEAVRYLRSAIEKSEEAEIAAHLGEVLWVTGDQQGARKVWQQAVKAGDKDPTLLDTLKRFSP